MRGAIQKWKTLRGVALITLLWGLLNCAIRLFVGFDLAMDDAKENIFTQSLEWGYLPDNPPLFEWTLVTIQQLTGPTLWSFLIVKYGLLIATACFSFLTARRLLKDQQWAAITALSLVTLYQLGWNYHQAFTHSCMVIFAVSFSLWAFIRTMQEPRLLNYLLFGFSIGLGLMSKYNFAGFLMALIFSALLLPKIRQRLLHLFSLIALVFAAIILAPHILWVTNNAMLFGDYVGTKLGWTQEASHLARIGDGIYKSLIAIISFYLPFIILAVLIFPKFRKRHLPLPEDSDAELLLLLRNTALAGMGLILAGVIIFGVSGVTERYVIPFFLPSFFWLIARMKAAASVDDGQRVQLWMMALACFAGFILLMRLAIFMIAEPPLCDPCKRWVPYDGLVAQMKQAGVEEESIFIVYDEDTAGNLRKAFPKAYIRSVNLMFYQPQKTDENRVCYFVWSEDIVQQPLIPLFQRMADQKGRMDFTIEWKHPLKDHWNMTHWGVSPQRKNSKLYERFCTANGFRLGRKSN
ncbi:MAG: ArnT family glycosyltransferase [bacterium]